MDDISDWFMKPCQLEVIKWWIASSAICSLDSRYQEKTIISKSTLSSIKDALTSGGDQVVDSIFGYSFVGISVLRENHQIRINTFLDYGLHHSSKIQVSVMRETLHHIWHFLLEDNDRSIGCYSEVYCKLSYLFHSQSSASTWVSAEGNRFCNGRSGRSKRKNWKRKISCGWAVGQLFSPESKIILLNIFIIFQKKMRKKRELD